jgi:hypothetical protein
VDPSYAVSGYFGLAIRTRCEVRAHEIPVPRHLGAQPSNFGADAQIFFEDIPCVDVCETLVLRRGHSFVRVFLWFRKKIRDKRKAHEHTIAHIVLLPESRHSISVFFTGPLYELSAFLDRPFLSIALADLQRRAHRLCLHIRGILNQVLLGKEV